MTQNIFGLIPESFFLDKKVLLEHDNINILSAANKFF